MRMYTADSRTPTAAGGGAKWSPPRNIIPKTAKAGQMRPSGTPFRPDVRSELGFPIQSQFPIDFSENFTAIPYAIRHQRRVQKPPHQAYKRIPDVINNAASITSSTSGTSPEESGAKQRHQIFQDLTDSTTTASNGTIEKPRASHSSESFQFDMKVVKNAEKRSATAFERWEDDISQASSSTLSTRSLHAPSEGIRLKHDHTLDMPSLSQEFDSYGFLPPCKVVRKRISARNPHPMFGAFESPARMTKPSSYKGFEEGKGRIDAGRPEVNGPVYGGRGDDEGWTTPPFFEREHAKPAAGPHSSKAEADDISWITFTTDSFQPIEQPRQPPQKAAVLAGPKPKQARANKASSSRLLEDIETQKLGNVIRIERKRVPPDKPRPEVLPQPSQLLHSDELRNTHPSTALHKKIIFEQPLRQKNQPEDANRGSDMKPVDSANPIQSAYLDRTRSLQRPKTPGNTAMLELLLQQRNNSENTQQLLVETRAAKPNGTPNLIRSGPQENQCIMPRPDTSGSNTRLELLLKQRNHSAKTQQLSAETVAVIPVGPPDPIISGNLDRTRHSQRPKAPGNDAILEKPFQQRNLPGIAQQSLDAIGGTRRPGSPKPIQHVEQHCHPQPFKTPRNASVLNQLMQQRNHLVGQPLPSESSKPSNSLDLDQPYSEQLPKLGQLLQHKNHHKHAKCALTETETCLPDESEEAEMTDSEFIKFLNENPSFDKYARMVKVGLPLPIVKNAMQRDGVAPASKPAKEASNTPTKTQASPPDPIQRFRLHWETHTNVRSNTMWAMIGREDHWLSEVTVDEEEMAALFQKDRRPAKQKSDAAPNTDSESGTRVIEPKRANNCGIILARIKLSYREIATAIDTINDTALTLEQIKGITPYIPTAEEARALQDHIDVAQSGQPFRVECEKFMAEMMRVENAKQKIEAISFMKRLPICIEELKNDSRLIQKACEETMNSSSLRKVLSLVLHLGNVVNTMGTRGKDKATAIQLSSLLKLHQAKAFDRKTSFLEYVARILRRNSPGVLLQYRQELASMSRAASIQWTESVAELEAFDENLIELRQMALKLGLSASKQKHVAISSLSPEDEVRLLQSTSLGRFVLEACLRMSTVYAEIDAAKTVFDQLIHYFGEKSANNDELPPALDQSSSAQQILSNLAQFCSDLDAAVERAAESEKAKARELRRVVVHKATETAAVAVSPSSSSSSRLMVDNRGTVVKARAKPGRRSANTGMRGLLADLTSRRSPKKATA